MTLEVNDQTLIEVGRCGAVCPKQPLFSGDYPVVVGSCAGSI